MKKILASTALSTVLLSLAATAQADGLQKVGVVTLAGAGVTDKNESGERVLKTGDDIFLGDVIKTGKGSETQLVFLDHSTLTLKPGSDITVDSFVYDPKNASGGMALKSAEGAFRFIGGVLSKKKPVEITTPVGTIGIRGGIVDATVAPGKGATDAVFVYGEQLNFSNANGQTTSTTTYGTGFNLASATALPKPLDQAALNTHFSSFNAPANANGTGGQGGGHGEPKLDLGTEKKEPKPAEGHVADANAPAETPAAANTAAASTPAGEGNSGTAANNSLSTAPAANSPAATSPSITTPVEVAAIRTTVNTTQTDKAVATAAASGTLQVATGQTPPPPTGGTAATPPAATGNAPVAAVVKPVATAEAAYTHQGVYSHFLKNTASMDESGVARGYQIDAATLQVLPGDNSFSAGLPWLASTGAATVQSGDSAVVDGESYNVTSYISSNGAMRYFLLDNANEQAKILVGTSVFGGGSDYAGMLQAARDASVSYTNPQGTNSISFYDFLPQMNTSQQSITSVGPFNYNMPFSAILLAGHSTPAIASREVGLAVDWQQGGFLTSNIAFDSAQGQTGVVTAYGHVNNGGGDGEHFLAGTMTQIKGLDSATDYHSQLSPNQGLVSGQGNVSVGKAIYGNGQGIEGLLVNYHLTNAAGGSLDNRMPVSRVDTASSAQAAAAGAKSVGLSNGTLNGFAGGLPISDAGGASGVESYVSMSPSDVQVTHHLSTGTTDAALHLSSLTGAGPAIDASFGHAVNPTKSAYVSDRMWAAQQQAVNYNGTAFSTGANAANGALIAASHSSNVSGTPGCTTCQYTQWGVWSGDIKKDGATRVDIAPMVPVVVGQVTQNLATSGLTSTVIYNGAAYGNVLLDNSHYANAVGSMTAQVDLGARNLNYMTMAFPVGSLPGGENMSIMTSNSTPIAPAGMAAFNKTAGLIVQRNGTTVPGATAVINGALFGPAAEEIGGSYGVNSPNLKAGGVFQGKR